MPSNSGGEILECSLEIAGKTFTPNVGESNGEGNIGFCLPPNGNFSGSGVFRLVHYPTAFGRGNDSATIEASNKFKEMPLTLAGHRKGNAVHLRVTWQRRVAGLEIKIGFLQKAFNRLAKNS